MVSLCLTSFIDIETHVSLAVIWQRLHIEDDDHYQKERRLQRQHEGPLGELGGSRKELGGLQTKLETSWDWEGLSASWEGLDANLEGL